MTINEFAEKYFNLVKSVHGKFVHKMYEDGFEYLDGFYNFQAMYNDLDDLIYQLLANNGYTDAYNEVWNLEEED